MTCVTRLDDWTLIFSTDNFPCMTDTVITIQFELGSMFWKTKQTLYTWQHVYTGFFYCLFIYVLPLEIQLSRGEGWDPINWLNAATFFVPVQSQDLDFQHHMSWSIYLLFSLCSVSSVKMRDDCSFCWYWWNWWHSLFKLSFHNSFIGIISISTHCNIVIIKCLVSLSKSYVLFS